MSFCKQCNIECSSNRHYRTLQHKENCSEELESGVKLVETAFKDRVVTYHISTNTCLTDIKLFLEMVKNKVISLLNKLRKEHSVLKVNMELFGHYVLASTNEQSIKSFNSKYGYIHQTSNLENFYTAYQDILLKKASEFSEQSSGWALVKLLFLELNVNKSRMVGGKVINTWL